MKQEEWADIIGYEGLYRVSNEGRIRSLKNQNKIHMGILRPYLDGKKYLRVSLNKENVKKQFRVHRLVALHFILNLDNKPDVNHIDGNPFNNKVDNLEWCTESENISHAYRVGLMSKVGEKHSMAKLNDEDVVKIKKQLRNKTLSRKIIANMFNVSRATIQSISDNRNWKHITI